MNSQEKMKIQDKNKRADVNIKKVYIFIFRHVCDKYDVSQTFPNNFQNYYRDVKKFYI